MRSPRASTDLRKSLTLGRENAVSMAERTRRKCLRIGHRNHCLFMQSAQHNSYFEGINLERETGIEPATNSLEG